MDLVRKSRGGVVGETSTGRTVVNFQVRKCLTSMSWQWGDR